MENEVVKITTEKPHGFAKGDEVKFFAEGKKEVIKTIESVGDSQNFIIKGWTNPTNNLFIYGKKVSDFRAIDFDQITALSVAAIQELCKQVNQLKLENEKLNKKTKAKQAELEKRLSALESKIK
jgi:allophanate hydrolase subunit 1